MECPECGLEWDFIRNYNTSSTFPMAYCAECKNGPFVVDYVDLLKQSQERKKEKQKEEQ